MKVVVGVARRGLAIESDGDILAGIAAQINGHVLAVNRTRDVVINILGTRIVPLAENLPCTPTVCGNQHNELVIGTIGLRCT